MKKPRKKYRPKPVIQNPIEFVISGMRPVRDMPGVYLDVQIKNRQALEHIRTGIATRDDIEKLIGAFNISEALAVQGMGRDWLEEIKQGQTALLELSRRGVANGMRFIMTAKQWELLKLVMDLHEEQLAQATVLDIERAYDFVEKAFRLGKVQAIVETRKEKE